MKKMGIVALVGISLCFIGSCEPQKDYKSLFSELHAPKIFDTPILKTTSEPADLSISDPALVRVGNMYYLLGSNGVWAKSIDLINWARLTASGDFNNNGTLNESSDQVLGISIFKPADMVLSDNLYKSSGFYHQLTQSPGQGLLWTSDANQDGVIGENLISVGSATREIDTIGYWSPSAIKLKNGQYAFYHSYCNLPKESYCSNHHSYIAIAKSSKIDKDFEKVEVIMQSATSSIGYDGTQWDEQSNPSAFNPEVFYDKEQKLWMVYGSYAGGIWIKELDPETGLPLDFTANQRDYGKHLAGGSNGFVRSPSIIYNRETNYYYLFLTYTGFDIHDNFNQTIRVARSSNPDGPYLDINGKNLIDAGTERTSAIYGTKLVSSVLWKAELGEKQNEPSYSSPGNNTVYYDETGKYYFIFDAYLSGNKNSAHLKIHEMQINQSGWPVVLPIQNTSIEGDNIVDYQDVIGDYKIVNQGIDNNVEPSQSQYISLLSDGTIIGTYAGKYSIDNENNLELNLDGLGVFHSKTSWQLDELSSAHQLTPVFSGLSDKDGAAIWGIKLPKKSSEELFSDIDAALKDKLPKYVIQPLSLPTAATRGIKISWHSSDNFIVNLENNTINRPEFGQENVVLHLSATIKLTDGQTKTIDYPVSVPARSKYNLVSHYKFDGKLSDAKSERQAAVTGPKLNIHTNSQAKYDAGVEGNALKLDGSYGLDLGKNIIQTNQYTISYWMKPIEINTFQPSVFIARNNPSGDYDAGSFLGIYNLIGDWATNTTVWNRNGSDLNWPFLTTTHKAVLNKWQHVALSCDNGHCTVFIDGEASGTAQLGSITGENATLAIGVNLWDIAFMGLIDEFKVYDEALSKQEVNALDYSPTPSEKFIDIAADSLVQDINAQEIKKLIRDLSLPTKGLFGSKISWSSDNQNSISSTGKIQRPKESEQEITVNLTAILILGEEKRIIPFQVTLPPVQIPATIVSYGFNNNVFDNEWTYTTAIYTGSLLTEKAPKDFVAKFSEGIEHQGLYLDGKYGIILNDKIKTGKNYALSVWLKPESLTHFSTSVFRYVDGRRWFSLVPYNDKGNLQLWTLSAEHHIENPFEFQLEPNQWVHTAFSVSGNKVALFLNGKKVGEYKEMPDLFSNEISNLAVGVNFWDKPFRGVVDELVLFNGEIGEAEANKIYKQQN